MEEAFADIYILENPLENEFKFKWDGVTYRIAAKGSKLLPRPLAEHGASKLVQQIIQRTHGFDGLLRKKLVKSEMDKICRFYEINESQAPNGKSVLQSKIEELNPEEEQELEEASESNEVQLAPGEEVLTEEEAAAFSELEQEKEQELEEASESNDEDDRKEALKESDPRAFRAEQLDTEFNKSDVAEMAKGMGIEVANNARKSDIIEAIVAREFSSQ